MTVSRHISRFLVFITSLGLAGATLVVQTATARAAGSVTVHKGQHIQPAIDAAAPGTTIVVEEGTYKENLVIPTDGITLRGEGDAGDIKLEPPAKVAPVCFENASDITGICVANMTGGPVRNVHISNLTIRNFSNSGILAFGASGLRVDDVRSINNGGYGVFALQSTGTRLTDNLATGNHEAGFYLGESPNAAAVVSDNDAHGNGFGIFFRDSRHATITDNNVSGNCAGIVFLNTQSQGSPGVGDVVASDNTGDKNNLHCLPGDRPAISGIGTVIIGGDHITVRDNTFNGNVATGATPASGGIIVFFGSSFITVKDNDAHHNATDIIVATPSVTNHISDNECSTSSPGGLC
jgi:parallel beta-helix repeat protein